MRLLLIFIILFTSTQTFSEENNNLNKANFKKAELLTKYKKAKRYCVVDKKVKGMELKECILKKMKEK